MELSRTNPADVSETLAHLSAVTASTLDVARVSIWLFNEAHTELRSIHLLDRTWNLVEIGAVLDVTRYPRYFATLEQSRTIAATDASTHPGTSEFAVGYLDVHGISSMLDVPIRREGRIVGVLCIEHVGPSRQWTIEEQNFAASLADLTALVLETDRRRQVERELRASFNQLDVFFSQSLDGFFFMMLDQAIRWDSTTDPERLLDHIFTFQRVTKANDAMLRQYRTTEGEFLGKTPADLFAHNLAHGRDLWRRMFEAGRLHTQSEVRRADGSPMWVDGDYICFYDAEGRITGHFGVQRDVTERKRAEEALARSHQRLRILWQTDRAILAVRSVNEIADAALTRLHQLVPCRRASVAVVEPDGITTKIVGVLVTTGTSVGVGTEVPLAVVENLDAFRQGWPNIVRDLSQVEDQSIYRALYEDGIRSSVSVPMLANGELIGSMNLGSSDVDGFSAENIEIAQEVADGLAVAIHHAKLLHQIEHHAADLERRVAERTAQLSHTNAKLRESEDRVRSLYNNTPVMMHSIDEKGRLVDVNEFWLKTVGYERHEVIGQPVSSFAAPEYREYVREVMFPTLLREGFVRDMPVQALKKNGERVDVEVTSVIRRDQHGAFLHSQAFLLDVTERNRAQQARLETEERLASIFRSAMDAIIVIDAERRIVIFNLAAEKMFGCSANEAIGQPIDRCLPGQFTQILTNAIHSSGPESAQVWVPEGLRAVRKNGEQFPVEATVSQTDVSTGRLFTIILRDVNERERAAEMLDQLHRENIYLQEELQSELNFEDIVGASPAMEKIFANIAMVAQTDSTVLLLGETGTGKELIARALHNRSQRKQSVMVKVNCGALPANLVESELFGHEKGAFTGALMQKKGRFELAHRGTLFLDEVGELPLEAQTKLLRVLQEQEFERVGGHQTQKVDVRVIAATNRNLEEEIRRGTFRADLFYRLNVFPIEVPPLRRRKEDIPLLASYFVRKFSQRMGKRIDNINRGVYDQLLDYDWPGNVRELANLMERAVIFCQNDTLQPKHLATTRMKQAPSGPEPLPTMEEAERRLIRRALEQTGGVLAGPAGAAAILGVNRSTLWSRMRKLGVDLPKRGPLPEPPD